MKSILFSAAFAIVTAFAATDASAQQVIGKTSGSDRPMPTNAEITNSKKEVPMTDGKPMEQIRANETDSPRNRNEKHKELKKTTHGNKAQPASQPADRNCSEAVTPAPAPAPAR